MSITKKPIFTSKKRAVKAAQEGNARCFDCGTEMVLKEEKIENGSLLIYEDVGRDIFVFKCDECLAKSSELSDYKECEVYSRIVGYLRPVKQWNEGKQQEYSERKEYNKVLQD